MKRSRAPVARPRFGSVQSTDNSWLSVPSRCVTRPLHSRGVIRPLHVVVASKRCADTSSARVLSGLTPSALCYALSLALVMLTLTLHILF